MRRRTILATVGTAAVAAVIGAGTAAAVLPGTTPPGPTPQPAQNVREFPLTPISTLPESVVYDAKTKSFFASSENGGSITQVTYPQGVASTFLPPGVDGAGKPDMRTEAVGLALDKQHRLYVAGGKGGHVYVYSVDTKKLVADFDTGLTGYVNDLTVNPQNGDLYATDSFQPTIYRWTAAQVAAGKGEAEKITISPEVAVSPVGSNPPKPFNANGIRFTPDNRFIMFDDLNDAALYRMTIPPKGKPAQRQITKVAVSGGSLGDADGLEFAEGGPSGAGSWGGPPPGDPLGGLMGGTPPQEPKPAEKPEHKPGHKPGHEPDHKPSHPSGHGGPPPGTHTLYVADNGGERILNVTLTDDYTKATIVKATTSTAFHTPTGMALAPGNNLLVANSRLFDPAAAPPFTVVGITRP